MALKAALIRAWSKFNELRDPLNFYVFFVDVFTSDADARGQALDDFASRFRQIAHLVGSSSNSDSKTTSADLGADDQDSLEPHALVEKYGRDILDVHLPVIYRMCLVCPFPDIQEAFESIIKDASENGITLPPPPLVSGPSFFVSIELCPSPHPSDKKLLAMFENIFMTTGRLSHLNQLIGWHPTFLAANSATMQFVLRDDGPLEATWRHYIAILAASRYRCQYLIDLHELLYLQSGGDPSWLQDYKNSPVKLQNIMNLNAKIAHQPWKLGKEDFADLVRGDNRWTTPELLHAVVLMVTFSSLAGFVYGVGVAPEIDCIEPSGGSGTVLPSQLQSDVSSGDEKAQVAVADLEEVLKSYANTSGGLASQEAFEKAGMSINTTETTAQSATAIPSPKVQDDASLERFRNYGLADFKLSHEDFKSDKVAVFRTHDFNWQEHGYAVVNQHFPGLAELLDEEFDVIFNLTYHTVNDKKDVDTTPFRQAIWYYAHRLYGIFHDDYDYNAINKLLHNIDLKKYIKKVACDPDSLTFSDFQSMGFKLSPDEKAHICLLAMEGHKSSSLLYGLREISRL